MAHQVREGHCVDRADQGVGGVAVACPVGDAPESDLLANPLHGQHESVLRPGLAASVPEQWTALVHSWFNQFFRVWRQEDHPGVSFSLALVGRENGKILVDVPCLNCSPFFGAAASRPQKVEQSRQGRIGVFLDFSPLLGRVDDLSTLATWFDDFGDGRHRQIFLFDRPIEHPLNDGDRIVLAGGGAFVFGPAQNVMLAEV